MGKFHHVEAKAIKREQLKHHQILYILKNIFVYRFKKKKKKKIGIILTQVICVVNPSA